MEKNEDRVNREKWQAAKLRNSIAVRALLAGQQLYFRSGAICGARI